MTSQDYRRVRRLRDEERELRVRPLRDELQPRLRKRHQRPRRPQDGPRESRRQRPVGQRADAQGRAGVEAAVRGLVSGFLQVGRSVA